LLKQISYVEIISTVVLLAMVVVVVVDLSRVFHVVDSATLQPVHRCTPAPYGILAVPAALPTLPQSMEKMGRNTLADFQKAFMQRLVKHCSVLTRLEMQDT